MEHAKNVIEYYVLCNKLKNVVRTGWKDWGVKRDRVESIAEHIYGTQMLAVAMWSEYKYDIDLKKVLSMLAMHELEETIIGDLTQFQIDAKTKAEMGKKAVGEILTKLSGGSTLEELISEFEAKETNEAQFAYLCDKLECDLQCKLYDEEGTVDLTKQQENKTAKHPLVQQFLNSGDSWGEMWLKFGQAKYPYDAHFKEVSTYALTHKISEPKEMAD